ncbi:beta-1,3-galactosyl-O-glycosyl-glycoprotein beta-1,6-N-acetylglucosaminyltransferase 7 [Neosynchiropus ocellatus]
MVPGSRFGSGLIHPRCIRTFHLCYTMLLRHCKKAAFLLSLGISIVGFLVIYIRTANHWEMPGAKSIRKCRPFSSQCGALLSSTAAQTTWHRRDCWNEGYILKREVKCSALLKDLHFITRPLSYTEEKYPLAFILTVHKELGVLLRLLRAIYMPQNVYCIHIDAKAPVKYQEAIQKMVSCFQNIFISSRSETVTYAGFSRLQADLNCMEDLAKSKVRWRKVINLCGQDFPIKTNLELVQHLQRENWREKNITPGIKQPVKMRPRTELQYTEGGGSHVKCLGVKKSPPPHNIQIYFGTAYYAVTRQFVEFVLSSQKARDLLEWSRDTYSPDEHFWVTLNHLPEAPGSNIDGGWAGNVRAIKWSDQAGKYHNGCKGRYVRDICVYGEGDLQWIINTDNMFANKFESKTSPEALDCLEQWHRNKVLRGATIPIETSWLLATSRNITAD